MGTAQQLGIDYGLADHQKDQSSHRSHCMSHIHKSAEKMSSSQFHKTLGLILRFSSKDE